MAGKKVEEDAPIAEATIAEPSKTEGKSADKAAIQRREIPGGLPYLTSHGTLKRILDRAIELAKPDKFNYDFLENVVKITGGAARACIPIMKKMGFLNSDNSTTDLYGKFRTEGGRSSAAYMGLRNAFPEVFKRSDYAFKVEDAKLRDIILEITGLKAADPVAQAIKGTFGVIKAYIDQAYNPDDGSEPQMAQAETVLASEFVKTRDISPDKPLSLSYNINIVLPETSDLTVLNAIFKSVRENLLR